MVTQKEKELKRLRDLKYKARRYSIKEGIFSSAKMSFGDHYISPFAIAINASNSAVALLSAITGLLGPLTQMFSSKLIGRYSRKKIILKAIFFEALMWLPLIAIAILFYKNIIVNILPLFLLLSFSIYIILANVTSPAWFSWMGDVISERYRGRYFSKRNLITGFVAVVLGIASAFFLDYFKNNNWTMFGFGILFTLAIISRFLSRKTFKKQYEPKIKLSKADYFSFWSFLIKAPKNNFGKFAIFRALISFTSTISIALLAIYLLRILKFDYKIYMIITFSSVMFSLIILEIWGRLADRYGNYRVLRITSFFIPMIPILWILFPNPIYLILVPSAIQGISWAGFNLATVDFVYDNVSPEKRGLAISYFNMLLGIGVFLGAGLGAILIKYLKISFTYPIYLIFIIASLLGIIVVLWWLPKIKEVKKTQKFKGAEVFKNIVFKQIRPTLSDEIHQVMSIKKYLRK